MDDPLSQTLDYHRPVVINNKNTHSPAVALLLCAPGAFTLGLLFYGVQFTLPDSLQKMAEEAFWPLIWLSAISAITSLILYARRPFRPLPWYVTLNLVLNIFGLFFLIGSLCVIW